MAGVYYYPDVPKDVWRRHDRCKCIITYEPEKGGRQHFSGNTKAWQEIDPEELEKASDNAGQYARRYFNSII